VTTVRRNRRESVVVRGGLVRVGRVGSTIVMQTTEQIYVTHVDWIPQLDDIVIARIRALYATRDFVTLEIARMFDIDDALVRDVVNGRGRFSHLPALPRPTWFGGKRCAHQERAR
jgi:hypothetical protein